jgi:hypothetical protein
LALLAARKKGERMPASHFTVHIGGPSEIVFALIADLTQYDRWLPRSKAFGLGTTYVDTGPSGAMQCTHLSRLLLHSTERLSCSLKSFNYPVYPHTPTRGELTTGSIISASSLRLAHLLQYAFSSTL